MLRPNLNFLGIIMGNPIKLFLIIKIPRVSLLCMIGLEWFQFMIFIVDSR